MCLVIFEWLIKLVIKIYTIASGLLINILMICMFVAICNRHWESVGLLALFVVIGLLLAYGNATILFLIGELKSHIRSVNK